MVYNDFRKKFYIDNIFLRNTQTFKAIKKLLLKKRKEINNLMKAKKILTNVLCVSMAVSNITPVFATVTNVNVSFEDTDTTALEQTEVLYEKAGSYFVTIPKTISLGVDKQSPYSVKVEGDIPSDKQVYVSPIDGITDTEVFDFYMHDQSAVNPKSDVVATVTQNKFYWNFSEVADGYAETDNQVIAEDLTSGHWKGIFDFEINMHKIEPEKPDFTLTTDGDVTLPVGESHQLNAYIDGVESNSDVVWSCDNENVTINDGLIELPSTLQAGIEITITVSKDSKTISFTITVEDDKKTLEAGLYDADDNLIVSWSDSGINNTCSNARNIIKNKYPNTTKVIISDSVTSISPGQVNAGLTWNYQTFRDCDSLTYIGIPDSVTSIGEWAFYGCRSLTSISIPDSVKNIGDSAFYGCTALKSVKLSKSITTIEYGLFRECSSLTDIEIPDSVTNIGSYAFSYCDSLTGISIPDSVKTIEHSAFRESKLINSVVLPDSVTSIESYAFYECTALTNINIPDSVTGIDELTFYNCTSLDLVIPDSVKNIDARAFTNVPHITYHGTATGSPWGAQSIN